ncbi:hypothetical protein ACTHPH_04395 [Paenibacillus pasadenensis]|uniref:Uncharacterized protein n=1 Tax=Paenibacillus pasadenensis TaxID=217090 RepID=A0A2N5N1Y3_9BACL|nr:hypothetical protein [Paenibacillus pasadenensis]PLT44339.1 hypothetical protein B8V81_2770 [Paenibacillus pasadenensis]
MTISPWLWPLPVLAVLALAFIYSRRKEQERHLLWKLLGYLLLGAFMLRLNGFPLPLGYALFLLLLQAKPKPNRAAKHSAAFAGLLLFFLTLALPAAEQGWLERERSYPVEAAQISQLSLQDDWERFKGEDAASSEDRLERFEFVYDRSGAVIQLNYAVNVWSGNGSYRYQVEYAPEKGHAVVQRLGRDGGGSPPDGLSAELVLERLRPEVLAELAPAPERADADRLRLEVPTMWFANGTASLDPKGFQPAFRIGHDGEVEPLPNVAEPYETTAAVVVYGCRDPELFEGCSAPAYYLF